VLEQDPHILVPGRHRLGASGASSYVIWGPGALALDVAPRPGVRAIELLEAPGKDAGHDGGVARERELALARARRLEQAGAELGGGLREPLSILADKPLAVTSIEVEPEEIALEVKLEPRDAVAAKKLEVLARAALVVRAGLAGEPRVGPQVRGVADGLDVIAYVARTFASTEADRAAARKILAAIDEHPSFRGTLEGAQTIRTDVWVALTTMDGSLGEGRVPVVIEHEGGCWAISVALSGDLAASRARELGLAATALARDLGVEVHAWLFVVA
jgi:hypothetical protein